MVPLLVSVALHLVGLAGGDDVVRLLAERGEAVASALQAVEDAAGNATCRRVALETAGGASWRALGGLERPMWAAVRTANVLNDYFLRLANDTEVSVSMLLSLVRTNVDGDTRVSVSSVALTTGSGVLVASAQRRSGAVRTAVRRRLERWPGNAWFWAAATANHSLNGSVAPEDGRWTAPHVDCEATGSAWHVTYGAPFFSKSHDDPQFKGVVSVSMPVTGVDIDQCDGVTPFSSSHHCDRTSTQCVPMPGRGFRRGAYRCYCKPSFYPASPVARRRGYDYHEGSDVERAFVSALAAGLAPPPAARCLPCRRGCDLCLGDQPCHVEDGVLLRSLVLCFQSFCSTLSVVLAVVVFVLRKTKIFSSSMWVMLETILVGALLLYQTVIIRYFEPSVLTCLLEPWFRGLGFAICYGAITLKIYRILAEFQTRKAHRVCVRDKDLLKYLLAIVGVVAAYLLAWTAVLFDHMHAGYSLVSHHHTNSGLEYVICKALWWDYVTEVGELLFLLFGVFLTYKVRNAKSDCFHEKETLAWSIYVEALVSLLMYTIRHVVWSNLLPDYIYLLYFLRCQCTVTLILFFIFAPKLWYQARPPEVSESCGDVRGDQLPETLKLHDAVTSNGDVDFSDINLSDMDPEDIRTELRRVYTQLQILRNLTMRKGNPHISRRRGGRKGTHRRFSLQTFHHRHKHHHDHQDHQDHELTEVSKTPEESTASLDVPQDEKTNI